jgi:hypothetical protein
MNALWIALAVVAALEILLGFLVLGLLQTLGEYPRRMAQVEAEVIEILNKSGLPRGRRAPLLTARAADRTPVSLQDYIANKKVFLVFVKVKCWECMGALVPELNRLQQEGDIQVVVVRRGHAKVLQTVEASNSLTDRRSAEPLFPVGFDEDERDSTRYRVPLTKSYGYVIDESGFIMSKGVIVSKQSLNKVLGDARAVNQDIHSDAL